MFTENAIIMEDTCPAGRTLYDFYNNLFEGVIANTNEMRQECFRLRHQVYFPRVGYKPSPLGGNSLQL